MNQTNELMLSELFREILKKLWLVIIVGVLSAAIGFSYCSFFATPGYETTISLFVNNGSVSEDTDKLTSADVYSSISIVETCVQLLQEPAIYDVVASDTKLGYTRKQLMNMIRVTSRSNEVLIIDVSVTLSNADEAMQIANSFGSLAPDYLKYIMPQIDSKVIRHADEYRQVSPRTKMITAFSMLLGVVFVVSIIVLRAMFNRTIKGEENFTQRYDIPVLGCVPDFHNTKGAKGRL